MSLPASCLIEGVYDSSLSEISSSDSLKPEKWYMYINWIPAV